MNKKILAFFMLFTMCFSTILYATQDATTLTANEQSVNATKNEIYYGTLTSTGADQNATLTYSIVSEATHGLANVDNSSTGTFSYEPETDYTGSDSFTFKVSDGENESEPATVTITVEEGDDAPTVTLTANDLEFTLEKNTILSNNLSGTSTEETAALKYIIVTQPTHGTLTHTDETSAAFSYTPETDYVGSDSFTYKISDDTNESTAATVSLTIEEPEEDIIPFDYRDMKNHWANYSASNLAAKGLIIGEEINNDYYFYPEREMTRSDYMLFLLAITADENDSSLEIPNVTFADEESLPDWLIENAKLAYAKGIIKGSAVGNQIYLNAYDKVSRIEAIMMINNVLKPADTTEDVSYVDKTEIPAWGLQAVKNLTSYKIIQGNSDNTFRPSSNITRAQAAELSYKLLKQIEKDGLEDTETGDDVK